jgi:GNAT superfamily N-acetyltransferase
MVTVGAGNGREHGMPDGIVAIELLQRRHLLSLAAAHAACFPDYFLTNMGLQFLQRYYEVYIDFPEAFGVVAVNGGGGVVAFAAGTADLSRHDAVLIRSHPLAVVWAVTKAAALNNTVRQQVLQRLTRIGKVMSRALRGPDKSATAPSGNGSPPLQSVTLTSIGVLPDHQGSGLSMTIINAFEREVRRLGRQRMKASTKLDNTRARAFYEKAGWIVTGVREEDNGIDFERVLAD